MLQNPRNQNHRGRSERDHERSDSDSRRQTVANPGLNSGEEDMERGRNNKNHRSSSILSSIDYDRNAE